MNKTSVAFLLFCMFFFSIANAQNEREWKVWIKTSPCSGRFDWVSVAKQNPSGGGNFFVPANQIFTGSSCTNYGCTYSEALSVANAIRPSDKFLSYCCHNYSVWKNIQTGKFSVVFGETSPGIGWQEVKGNLCCDEAETLAGLPGFCSGTTISNSTKHTDDCYPGSHAVYDKKHNTKQCYCNDGLVWNDAKTACVTIPELEKQAICNYPGSYAHWNPATQKVECWCPEGKKWNAARTACIDINESESPTNNGNGSSQDYASIFKRMLGTWRTDNAEITITGTYDHASGTIRKKAFCHPLSEVTAADVFGTLGPGKMGKNAYGQTALLIHYDFNDGRGNDLNVFLVLNDDDTMYFKYFPCGGMLRRVN